MFRFVVLEIRNVYTHLRELWMSLEDVYKRSAVEGQYNNEYNPLDLVRFLQVYRRVRPRASNKRATRKSYCLMG